MTTTPTAKRKKDGTRFMFTSDHQSRDIKGLTCIYLNARSVKCVNSKHNKLVELQNLVASSDAHVVAITETWLTKDVLDSEILPSNFHIYRKDREVTCSNKRGGGILLGIDNRWSSTRMLEFENNSEIMVCKIQPPSGATIAMILCYRPPNADKDTFTQCLDDILSKVTKCYSHVCVLGDFNLPDINWSTSSINLCAGDSNFVDVIDTHALEQINMVPSNKHGNVLDLVFTNSRDLYGKVSDLESTFPTDHTVLCFNIRAKYPLKHGFQRTIYNFKKANLNALHAQLHDIGLLDVINRDSNVDEAWSSWLQAVTTVVNNCVPKLVIKSSTTPPWFDKQVRHLLNKKNTARRRAKKSNKKCHWARFRKLRNRLQNLLSLKYNNYINSLGDMCKTNPKRFWSFFHSKTRNRCIPESVMNNDVECTEPKDKAATFNHYFHSVFSNDSGASPPQIIHESDCTVSDPYFTTDQVFSVMKNLDVNKAVGLDGLSPFILKHCSQQLAPSLAALFNKSMHLAQVPSQWKLANVTPVFKKGDKHDVQNYRPISLLPAVSKIMERCLHDHIYPQVKSHIYNLQHGFVKGRSCTSQLLKVYHSVGSILDKGGQVDIAYLDFSKAFDCVSHRLLLYKLEKFYGVSGNLISWIDNYLTDRKQRVVIENEASDWLPVTSGVPQGSILGPLFFLLFINDMPSMALSCSTALFADDAKCFKEIKSHGDSVALQNDLNNLHSWGVRWGMCFNAQKCKILSVTRSRSKTMFTYTLNGTPLEHVGNFKDLGVVVNSSLSWSPHIESIICSSKKVCGMIKRSVGYHAPVNVKLQLYKSIGRGNIEYSSQVWSPHNVHNIHAVESVQRSMTRYIVGNSDLSYSQRCKLLNILPLSFRREIADLTFMYKYLHGALDVDFHDEIQVTNVNPRLRSSSQVMKLQENFARTETFKGSFFNRIVRLWNILPLSLRNCESLSTFKAGLNTYYLGKLNSFNVECACTWISNCRCFNCLSQRC